MFLTLTCGFDSIMFFSRGSLKEGWKKECCEWAIMVHKTFGIWLRFTPLLFHFLRYNSVAHMCLSCCCCVSLLTSLVGLVIFLTMCSIIGSAFLQEKCAACFCIFATVRAKSKIVWQSLLILLWTCEYTCVPFGVSLAFWICSRIQENH